jgi:hypothetical protein
VSKVVYEITGFCPPAPENTALEREDGGAALIFHTNAYESAEKFAADELREEPEHGMFVRIQSYDERIWEQNGALPEAHDEIRQLFGKRVRVTVEVLDEND